MGFSGWHVSFVSFHFISFIIFIYLFFDSQDCHCYLVKEKKKKHDIRFFVFNVFSDGRFFFHGNLYL